MHRVEVSEATSTASDLTVVQMHGIKIGRLARANEAIRQSRPDSEHSALTLSSVAVISMSVVHWISVWKLDGLELNSDYLLVPRCAIWSGASSYSFKLFSCPLSASPTGYLSGDRVGNS